VARVIFSLTDAQAAALSAIRAGAPLGCDPRVWSGLVKRGLASGNFAVPALTLAGVAAASLAEMLAIPADMSGGAGD
jgi:hypothetical protein